MSVNNDDTPRRARIRELLKEVDGDIDLASNVVLNLFLKLTPEQQRIYHIRFNDLFVAYTMPLFERDCAEADDVVNAIMKSMRHTQSQNLILALAYTLKILLDSNRDDDLVGDMDEEVADVLFPDDEQRMH